MRARKPIALIALSLALSAGTVLAQDNIDRVSGGITAEANREYGSLTTVNGGITLKEGARARSAETVNGGIRVGARARVGNAEAVNGGIELDADAQAGSVEVVNGGITLREGARVENDAETVNGGFRARQGVHIGGDASTVNGAISLVGARVGGDLVTTNGDITLARGAVVVGELRVEKPQGAWWSTTPNRKPRIVIGANSVVEGSLVFEREVELFVHPSARIGTVTGATAQPFTEALPERD